MGSRPTLSIIIPAYNEEHGLAACLEAIERQVERPNEVIVVNNNSTDGTAEVARRFGFVKVVEEDRQGIAYAHQAGFAAARGQLLARIDADSILPATWVRQVRQFYADPGRALTTLVGTGAFYNLRWPALVRAATTASFVGSRWILGHYPGWGPNMVVPRVAWKRIASERCFENDIHDDLDISMHLHAAGLPIVWRNDLVVWAQQRHYDSLQEYYPYLLRGARNHRRHGRATWPLAYAMAWLLAGLQYPVLKLLTVERPRLMA